MAARWRGCRFMDGDKKGRESKEGLLESESGNGGWEPGLRKPCPRLQCFEEVGLQH